MNGTALIRRIRCSTPLCCQHWMHVPALFSSNTAGSSCFSGVLPAVLEPWMAVFLAEIHFMLCSTWTLKAMDTYVSYTCHACIHGQIMLDMKYIQSMLCNIGINVIWDAYAWSTYAYWYIHAICEIFFMYSFSLYISILFSYLSIINYFIVLFCSNSLLVSVLP